MTAPDTPAAAPAMTCPFCDGLGYRLVPIPPDDMGGAYTVRYMRYVKEPCDCQITPIEYAPGDPRGLGPQSRRKHNYPAERREAQTVPYHRGHTGPDPSLKKIAKAARKAGLL